MLAGLKVGDHADLVWRVTAEHVIHLGYPPPASDHGLVIPAGEQPGTSAVVFSTPFMVLLMERAARKVLEPFLEPGEVSVGATVRVDHLAGTPLGAEVRGVARVTAVEGRSVQFDVAAYDRHEIIGRGTHRRAVVRVAKVAERIANKAAVPADATTLTWMDGVAGLPAADGNPPGWPPDGLGSPAGPNSEERTMNGPTDLRSITPGDGLPPTETLRVEVEGAVATVTLDRPAKKNAVNRRMTEEWEGVNRFLAGHPEIRVVLVTGAGDTFCAGDDVPEVGTLSAAEAQELSYRQARMYLAWEQLPQVFIGVLNGPALGGGCVAACGCDLRIAAHQATLGMPEVLLGWPPGYGIAQLTALVGKGRAMEMCLLGRPLKAAEAQEIGLVHRVAAAGRLMAEARQWAEQVLALPADAVRETKRLVHADEGLQPKTAFLADTAGYIRCLGGEQAREGIAAFREKRRPRFSPGGHITEK